MPPRFSIRDSIPCTATAGNIVTATSDIPAHLWMRWTTIPPRIHKMPVLRRGMWLNDDVRFCFDVYQDVEQDEDGDTLQHTFTMAPCITGRHFWYYLWGYVGGILSPSTTPVLQYDCTDPCPSVLVTTIDADPDNRTAWVTWGTWPVTHDRLIGTIGPWHAIPTYMLLATTGLTASYLIRRSYIRFDTSVIPPGSTIVSVNMALWVVGSLRTSSAAKPYIYVTQGIQHSPVESGDYGAQLPYTTIGGQLDLADCIPDDVVAIELNAAGRSWVTPGAISRFCIRGQMDVEDSPCPLGFNSLAYGAYQPDSSKRPKLTIQYSPP